jgi:hypothetical protein
VNILLIDKKRKGMIRMTIKELIEKPTLKIYNGIEIKIEKDGYLLGIAEIDHNEKCALIYERFEFINYTYYMAFDEII